MYLSHPGLTVTIFYSKLLSKLQTLMGPLLLYILPQIPNSFIVLKSSYLSLMCPSNCTNSVGQRSLHSTLSFTCSCSHFWETQSLLCAQTEWISTKSDQRDYKPLTGRSFKPHLRLQGPQYITPFIGCHSSEPSSFLLQVSQDEVEHPDKTEVLTWWGSQECEAQKRPLKWHFEWVQIHQAAVASMEAVCNDRRP